MKCGYKVIKELGKHGLRGYYFSYRQYKDLAKITDFLEVKQKIADWGYPEVKQAKNEAEIVAFLRKFFAFLNFGSTFLHS